VSFTVTSLIDLANLSEILVEKPDIVDARDAIILPPKNVDDPDVVVEFDNVTFHYPTQPDTKGLKGLSFKMKKGTMTAIVGPTGEGKTQDPRLNLECRSLIYIEYRLILSRV
jgi:ABC-type multidrug transport system fused ATPase/permease subunit